MTKSERAAEVLRQAKELGCTPSKEGSWVVFRPPLPVDLILEASELGNEIAALVPSNA